MKTLARLTDKVIFNKEGLSYNRAVYRSLVLLRNSDDLYACIYDSDTDSTKLIETDKVFFSFRLRRLLKDLTGCKVNNIRLLGKVILNSRLLDFVQHTFLYLCETADKTKKKNSDVLLWLNLDEILDLLARLIRSDKARRKDINVEFKKAEKELQAKETELATAKTNNHK